MWQAALEDLSLRAARADLVDFTKVAASCQWPWALQLCRETKRRGLRQDVVFWGAIARSSWILSVQILGSVAAMQMEPNLILLNVATKNSSWPAALWLAAEAGDAANVITYSSSMSTCGTEWPVVSSLLLSMREVWVQPTSITLNTWITSLEHRNWDWALLALSEVQRQAVDVISFNATINACEKKQEWHFALALLGHVKEDGLEASQVTLNSVLSACRRRWEHALQLERHSDVISLNAMISACGMAADWQRVGEMLSSGRHQSVERDVVSFNASITAAQRSVRWMQALHWLAAVLEEASVISYNAAVSACESGFQWSSATNLVNALKVRCLEADQMTTSSMVSATGKAQQWELAVLALHTGRGSSVGYDAAMRSAPWQWGVGLLCHGQEAELTLDVTIYEAVVTACEQGSAPRQCLQLLSRVEQEISFCMHHC
ncbi:unnamed protein product [Durusdinium trenchii]|uniref:Uncharacterized protein n=2 Tax=Durusdinium trenchii TaxID=1381693 RepID=A0ABP0Q655_9DINO